MRGHTEKIRQVAEQKMADLQMKQTVSVAVTTCYFPDRTYGDVTFPAGNYEALRVEIGSAKGHNWWGMLYPELAFWDAVHTVNEETKSERDGILLSEEEKKPEKVKFRFCLQEIFQK